MFHCHTALKRPGARMNKREKLVGGLNLATARRIEIGPLCRPIVDKAESQVLYVDHADTESLRRKFASDPNVDVDKIVDIDGVWGEQRRPPAQTPYLSRANVRGQSFPP